MTYTKETKIPMITFSELVESAATPDSSSKVKEKRVPL